jgi:hypothetical protein
MSYSAESQLCPKGSARHAGVGAKRPPRGGVSGTARFIGEPGGSFHGHGSSTDEAPAFAGASGCGVVGDE